jgi:hypothetical protein
MLQPEHKGILALPKNSVILGALQRTVFFVDPDKGEGLKKYMFEQPDAMPLKILTKFMAN